MWFNPGAAQKHFQMTVWDLEAVNHRRSMITVTRCFNLNANAGSTRSCSEYFSEVGVKIGVKKCCLGPEGFGVSCYLMSRNKAWMDERTNKTYFLTKHSKSRAGRAMMKRSFFTNSVTKVNSELSERLYAWETQTENESWYHWFLILLCM